MLPISANELVQIQSDAASILDKTCEIQRATTATNDGIGSQSKTYTTIATVMAGMSQPTAGQLQNYDYLIGSLAAWQVHLPVSTDVQHQDRLLIDGQKLEVHILLNPRSYAALLTVLACEVK